MATEHERAGLVLVRREELVLLQAVERATWNLPAYQSWRAMRPKDRAYAHFHDWERALFAALDALAAGVSSADTEGR